MGHQVEGVIGDEAEDLLEPLQSREHEPLRRWQRGQDPLTGLRGPRHDIGRHRARVAQRPTLAG